MPDVAVVLAKTGLLHTIIDPEDLPRVKLQENGILSVGEEAIQEGYGLHVDAGDEQYWSYVAAEAIAALRYLKEHRP